MANCPGVWANPQACSIGGAHIPAPACIAFVELDGCGDDLVRRFEPFDIARGGAVLTVTCRRGFVSVPGVKLDAGVCSQHVMGSYFAPIVQIDSAFSDVREDGGATSLVGAFLLAPGPRFWVKPARFPDRIPWYVARIPNSLASLGTTPLRL